jgi:multiple sugar transport system substrate-binding protein
MRKRAATVLVTTLIASLVLMAGCGSKPADTKAPATTETAQKAPELKGEIEVTVPAGDYLKFMKDEIVPGFQQKHPGVTVKVTQLPDDNAQFTARVAANNPPDVLVGVWGYEPAKYAKMGKLVNLEGLPGSKELVDRIEPKYVHKDFGGLYYIPWNATTQMLIYNKALFQEAGITKVPETWAEYLEAAKKIQALPARKDGTKVYGNVFWNEALTWGGWYWTMLAQVYYSGNDGQYQLFNKLGSDIVFDKPEAHMADFLAFAKEAQKYAPPTMKEPFFNRNIGMWIQFGYGWKANFKEAKDGPMEIGKDVGVAPIPTREPGKTHWSTLDGRSLMLFKTTPEREAIGWEFMKALMEKENNLKALKALGQLPTLKELENDPWFQTPGNKEFVEQAKNALPNEPFAALDEVSNELLKVYGEVVVKGSMTPEQGVAEAAAKARDILKKQSQ